MAKKKKKSRFASAVAGDVDRRQKAQSNYGYLSIPKDMKMFKEGGTKNNYLDIIPYIVSVDNHPDNNPDAPNSAHKGNPWYKRPITIHRDIGVDNDAVICPKTIGKKCPICEHRQSQLDSGVEWKQAGGKSSLRNLYVVIPKDHDDYDEKMHLWDISDYMFQKMLDDELNEDNDRGGFMDPEVGQTLKIRFVEKKLGKNKFYETSRIDFEDRDEQYKDSIMEKAPNLDELFTVLSYKELSAKFMEMEVEHDDKDGTEDELPWDNEEKGKRKKKSAKSKKKEKTELKKDECPEGFKFGKDWDDFDECDKCLVRKACGKKHKKLAA